MDPFTFAIITGIVAGVGTAGLLFAAERSLKIMGWFKRAFMGLHFLVVGDDGVGKTSFYNLLRYDEYADNYPTQNTLEISEKMSFDVDKGGELEFQVKSAFDIPGPLEPEQQVDEVRKRAPEVLIIFLAADKDEKVMYQWLRMFLKSLSNAIVTDRKLATKLTCLTIVLNKIDLIKDDERNSRMSTIESTVNEILKPVLGKNVRLIDVYPCTLIKGNGGEKAANRIILSIVEATKLKQRLVRK